jgi:hypothetical protein
MEGLSGCPLVQRIGAWLFGLTFVFMGICFVDIAYKKQSWGKRYFQSLGFC